MFDMPRRKTTAPCQWPDDMVDLLQKHWDLGMSASQSAKVINDTFGTLQTRNSIIGKRHRMGLKRNADLRWFNRPKRAVTTAETRIKRAEKLAKLKANKDRDAEIARLRKAARAEMEMQKQEPIELLSVYTRDAVLSLKRNSCRFPIGVVGAPDFRFCCEIQVEGSSYCAEHKAICSTPVPLRIKR
jgi:GcrA cell cycle regulator